MARKPSTRPFHDPTQELLIITGMGNNSKDGEAVIKVQYSSSSGGGSGGGGGVGGSCGDGDRVGAAVAAVAESDGGTVFLSLCWCGFVRGAAVPPVPPEAVFEYDNCCQCWRPSCHSREGAHCVLASRRRLHDEMAAFDVSVDGNKGLRFMPSGFTRRETTLVKQSEGCRAWFRSGCVKSSNDFM